MDRIIAGLCAFVLRPGRLFRSAIVLKPSTILAFHKVLVQRKCRLLFSAKRHSKLGPMTFGGGHIVAASSSCPSLRDQEFETHTHKSPAATFV